MTRSFRDGHTGAWRAADAALGWWGPDGITRLVVATVDPGTLPDKATWYLTANLPRPGGPREGGSPHPAADLAEIVHAGPAALVLAPGDQGRPRLAFPVDRIAALVGRMVQGAPPRQLQELLDSVGAGHGLHLYIPN